MTDIDHPFDQTAPEKTVFEQKAPLDSLREPDEIVDRKSWIHAGIEVNSPEGDEECHKDWGDGLPTLDGSSRRVRLLQNY